MSNLAIAAGQHGAHQAGRARPVHGIRQARPVDRHVGTRVRMRRLQLELSQEKLAEALGITFQQVQKYEKGANRIGASRLVEIAAALQTTPAFFFEGLPGVDGRTVRLLDARYGAPDPVQAMAATKDGVALATAFNTIADREQRAIVLRTAEIFAVRGKR